MMDDDMIGKMIKESTSMARSDRAYLVPVIGAGVSLPLGLPDWRQLIQNLATDANINLDTLADGEPPDLLQEIKQQVGDTRFIARIQHSLQLPDMSTSATLQALITTGIKQLITTNLDYAIEVAFDKAGKSLYPQNVGRGSSNEELALFEHRSNETTLLKIHGSLERPSTWVLTREDYDKAYVVPGHLKDFFSRVWIPLFIGFSFHDFDIKESLRLAKLSRLSRAYTLIHEKDAKKYSSLFKNTGVIPVIFTSFDTIPETIDDIFQCSPLPIEFITHQFSKQPQLPNLKVGGAGIAIDQTVWDSPEKLRRVVDLLANAFEIQPERNVLDGRPRRIHGRKGTYRDKFIDLLKQKDTCLLTLILQGLVQYPEILFEGLTSSILKREDVDQYSFFKTFFDAIPENSLSCKRMEQLLLSVIHDSGYGYSCRRAVARLLASKELHPAMQIPPPHVKAGSLLVSIYPLTRYQVGKLIDSSELQSDHPLWPYTFASKMEIEKVIKGLRQATGKKWRIPSEEEWLLVTGLKEHTWPWGESPPEFRVHAHLRYLYQGGNVASQPVEVGMFPEGQSVTGLFDVIGNVYEIVTTSKEYALAGGSWTTAFAPRKVGGFQKISHWSTGKNNLGIRPVLSISDT